MPDDDQDQPPEEAEVTATGGLALPPIGVSDNSTNDQE
jgi:hypothetical protein